MGSNYISKQMFFITQQKNIAAAAAAAAATAATTRIIYARLGQLQIPLNVGTTWICL